MKMQSWWADLQAWLSSDKAMPPELGQPDALGLLIVLVALLIGYISFKIGLKYIKNERLYEQKLASLERIAQLFYEARKSVEKVSNYSEDDGYQATVNKEISRLETFSDLLKKDLFYWSCLFNSSYLSRINALVEDADGIVEQLKTIKTGEDSNAKKVSHKVSKLGNKFVASFEGLVLMARKDVATTRRLDSKMLQRMRLK